MVFLVNHGNVLTLTHKVEIKIQAWSVSVGGLEGPVHALRLEEEEGLWRQARDQGEEARPSLSN